MLLALPSFGPGFCATVVAAIVTVNSARRRRLHRYDPEYEIARFTARLRARANRSYMLRVPQFLTRWMGWA